MIPITGAWPPGSRAIAAMPEVRHDNLDESVASIRVRMPAGV